MNNMFLGLKNLTPGIYYKKPLSQDVLISNILEDFSILQYRNILLTHDPHQSKYNQSYLKWEKLNKKEQLIKNKSVQISSQEKKSVLSGESCCLTECKSIWDWNMMFTKEKQ